MIKQKYMKILLASSTGLGFILSYFLQITMNNAEQYMAVVGVVLLDGLFGIISGVKREGFKTYKALRIIKSIFTWVLMLTSILMIEKGFPGTSWLSETIIAPFIVFQVISALKNASMAGYVHSDLLNIILDKFDKHKGIRD
jgi:hypothetical protein